MQIEERGGVQLGRFANLDVPHGVALRMGGASNGPYASLNLGGKTGDDLDRVRENRHRFLAAAGLAGVTVVAPRQTHSADVAVLRRGDALPAGGVLAGDAVITDIPRVALMVLAADCAPLLLHDPERGVIAAVHAGWRGTAGVIATVAVRTMVEAFGCRPEQIRAGIGAAIGVCCYEVGPEVVDAIRTATPGDVPGLAADGPNGRPHIDLVAANVAQLVEAGVPPKQIATAGVCTACRTDLFFSHRREGEPTGRNGAVIALAGG